MHALTMYVRDNVTSTGHESTFSAAHSRCKNKTFHKGRWRCAGKTVYASTVNVRDKVAGFIVGLAGMSDRWDKDASPALLRCRSGLGRSSDPKVVALRQAVLEKCMAFKGPSPNLGMLPIPPPHDPPGACDG